MTEFETFLKHLQSQGLRYETGFLFADQPQADSNVIGYRMLSGVHQVDLYIRDEFWDADKSHVKLQEPREIAAGIWVTPISK